MARFGDDLAVDDDGGDAGGELARVVERGAVLDRVRIEHDQVGGHAGTHQAAVGQAQPGGRQRGHLADRFLEAQDAEFADVRRSLLARWAAYAQEMEESNEIWQDDGPLADPELFDGTWGPWRDDAGMAYAMYATTDRTRR